MNTTRTVQNNARPKRQSSFTPHRDVLLQRKCACGGKAAAGGAECAECQRKKLLGQESLLLQPKLAISQPGDRYEREADRVADAVMRMKTQHTERVISPDSATQSPDKPGLGFQPPVDRISTLVQREDDIEEGGVVDEVSRSEMNSSCASTVTPHLEQSIGSLRGGGRPLDSKTRSFFEPRFGYDFSQVRVHSGPRADAMARQVDARAFTIGPDVVFAEGEYAPACDNGKKLLAHELTHVVQQHAGVSRAIFRQPSIQSWEFKNSGTTSDDNCCALCRGGIALGLDCRPSRGYHNGMELKAFIENHEAGARYDIKRTKHRKLSERIGGTWNTRSVAGPGADDDSSDTDECLTPQFRTPLLNEYIYSEDRPGVSPRANPASDAAATDVAYIANFTESVEITNAAGSTTTDANSFDWHSVAWATKTNGSWAFNAASSEIEAGHRASVDP